jgi:formylglycine-generating enzyme required for sulfatase activity
MCRTENEGSYRFCLRCGHPLPPPRAEEFLWRRSWFLFALLGLMLSLLLAGGGLLLSDWKGSRTKQEPALGQASPTAGPEQAPADRQAGAGLASPNADQASPVAFVTATPWTAEPSEPTAEPFPMATSAPTTTPVPTITSLPTATPLPTAAPPTLTAIPTPTATPSNLATRTKDAMVMVLVDSGSFLMGATNADREANIDERPQHTVSLEAFWIDRTEVTNGQYQACVAAGVCRPSRFASDQRLNGANQPVVGVDWQSAGAYCSWVGARLPTEAEWEKAARGTAGAMYPWGNNAPSCGKANYWVEPSGCKGAPAAVGAYLAGASPYGVLDMAGNVWEWVSDWYDEGYYSRSPSSDPQGPGSGSRKVVRGGSWDDSVGGIRAANRHRENPGASARDLGFRCAAASPP